MTAATMSWSVNCGWRVVVIDAIDCWAAKRHVHISTYVLMVRSQISALCTTYRAERVGSVRV